jgi:hypothetical protein
MAEGVFGVPGNTFDPMPSAALDTADVMQSDEGGMTDEDILELEAPIVAETPAPAPMPSVIAELPLSAPQPVAEAPPAEESAEPEPERKQTLFERMLGLSRPQKAESQPVETLAPEPEASDEDDATVIPPFMRVQRN